MATYHVSTGALSGEIFAGTLSKDGKRWQSRTIVTEEAVLAVRDHLLVNAVKKSCNHVNYEWVLDDNTVITLDLIIRKEQKDA